MTTSLAVLCALLVGVVCVVVAQDELAVLPVAVGDVSAKRQAALPDVNLRYGKRGFVFRSPYGYEQDKRELPGLGFGKRSALPGMGFGKRSMPGLAFGKRELPGMAFGKRSVDEIPSLAFGKRSVDVDWVRQMRLRR